MNTVPFAIATTAVALFLAAVATTLVVFYMSRFLGALLVVVDNYGGITTIAFAIATVMGRMVGIIGVFVPTVVIPVVFPGRC